MFIDADTLTGDMRPIRRAVLSLGSNLGERAASLQSALDSLADTPEVFVTAVSPVYDTDPVDSPTGAEEYLNAVVMIDTTLSAHTLLERTQAIEEAFGRERGPIRNAPRTLDVDLILVGDKVCDDERLVLPHPRAHERGFVLAPWADIDPDAEVPGRGRVVDLLTAVGRAGVRRRDDIVLQAQ
jgi:2-amino-4-hydroxy-6-hydroxymethyldihydropteridine diphosphokinase